MKTEGKLWVLFDSVKNKKTKPLSVVQTQMMILTFKSRDMSNYHIWTPGWDSWLPLTEYLSSEQKHFVKAQPPEPVCKPKEPSKMLKSVTTSLRDSEKTSGSIRTYTEMAKEDVRASVDYGYFYNGFNGDDLSLSGIPDHHSVRIRLSQNDLASMKDRRATPRHDFKIEAVLVTKRGTSFRSYSRNISMTGTLLEDEVPKDFFNKPFELILINKFEKDPRNNRVHLTGRIIGDLSDPKRLVFLGHTDELSLKLKKLIDAYNLQQSKLRRDGA